jgi:phospholipid/cholesterol/gamma-HCH transport system permease protein
MDANNKSSIGQVIPASLQFDEAHSTLICSGDWIVAGLELLQKEREKWLALPMVEKIDASGIGQMDTAGAWILDQMLSYYVSDTQACHITGMRSGHHQLFSLVLKEEARLPDKPPVAVKKNILHRLGEATFAKWRNCFDFITFMGELFISVWRTLFQPWKFHWRSVALAVESTGLNALPIIALMSFLIGVVLAYQMGMQLEIYDANIYIVELSGMAILREFGPLIAAIIAAGRTSTAFTSEIGTMKVNEEIDALKTLGISPIERLVLPKLLAFVIALPLLTVWADGFGVFGSMVMSKAKLGVNYTDFLLRFPTAVPLQHYLVGIVKAPFFALIIVMVGCFQGFQVQQDAASVGRMTTRSAVQSLFLIIIVDAFFSVLFSMEGI